MSIKTTEELLINEIMYWQQRCRSVESRNDRLVDEIYKLRGFRNLTKEEIDKHNEEVDKINPTNHLQKEKVMNFGEALESLKQGKKVSRSGWNGKGMWLVLMPELNLPPFSSQEPGAKVNDRTAKHIGIDTPLNCNPYIVMWTADKKWQPGWLASQTDMLAEDWEII